MTIAPNVLHFAYNSHFVLEFAALNLVTLRKTASRFLRYIFYVSLNKFRGSDCSCWSTLLKPSPAFKRQIFGGTTVTRAFRRIGHGNKVKIKTSAGQFGTIGKMPACICRAVCIIIPPLSHVAEVTSWAMRRKNFPSWRGFLFNPGAGTKQRQPAGHGGEPER